MTDLLREAVEAQPGDLIHATPAEVTDMARRCFLDGLKMAASICDDLETGAKLHALISAMSVQPSLGK